MPLKQQWKQIEFPGFVGLARVTHGLSNGENLIIYGTYSNLNDAFTFETPKSEAEAKAFGKFFDVTGDISEFTQTWTRVKNQGLSIIYLKIFKIYHLKNPNFIGVFFILSQLNLF